MEIDIITFTDEQFASLTAEQILEVKEVQLKKNKLLRSLAKQKAKVKYDMVSQGIFWGASYDKVCQQLQAATDEEIENLRDGLLFYLRFSARDEVEEDFPYTVDYSLSYSERIRIVREYYQTQYTNPVERLNAFKEDKVALSYLGEFYGSLYEEYYYEANGV